MGLACRTDFAGERGICTRPCNFGCPTGSECVAEIPDYNGGVVRDHCLRTCAAQSDCEADLGSECDNPGAALDRRYCF